jgi:hypothetical protein
MSTNIIQCYKKASRFFVCVENEISLCHSKLRHAGLGPSHPFTAHKV